MDPLSNELMQQTETLRSELNGIKKTLALKEQQLIEKDKTVSSCFTAFTAIVHYIYRFVH